MKKMRAAGLALVFVLAGCASGAMNLVYTERTVSVQGTRGNSIPAILTVPRGEAGTGFPVVLVAHGHGGSKSENGGFDRLARTLAERGILSLRMDFAGCGDSTESFTSGNRLSFMIDDVAACKEYLRSLPEADLSRLGILGYSMGGRVAAVTAGRDRDYRAVVFWAPAVAPGGGDIYGFMQISDEAAFTALQNQARRNGSAQVTTVFGAEQTLGSGWFDDMVQINPLSEFSGFQGALLLILGSADTIIPRDNAMRIIQVAPRARLLRAREVQGADHGFGIYSDNDNLVEMVVVTSANFFRDNL